MSALFDDPLMYSTEEVQPLVVNTVASVSSKPLYSAVASQLVWLEQATEEAARDTVKVGVEVTVREDFLANSVKPVHLRTGDVGKVCEIDDERDALIEFLEHGRQWVRRRNFEKLNVEKDLQHEEYPFAPAPAIYCETNARQLRQKLPFTWQWSWATQYLGLPDLCDKGNFARMATLCKTLCPPNTWDFNPRTWLLPEQHGFVVDALQKGKYTYIFKPRNGTQGDGIFLAKSLPEFTKKVHCSGESSLVCQQYLARPLLLDGFKFDLRMYVCLLGGSSTSAPFVSLCKEGLARFCTERYEEPASKNMEKSMAHLTNYSLNKKSDSFKQCSEDIFDISNHASKRPLTVALRQVEEANPAFDQASFYDEVARLVQTTFSAMAPLISAYHRCCGYSGDINAVQIIGIDVILDREFKPYLLELNNSPSLRISDPHPLCEDGSSTPCMAKVSIECAGTASANAEYTEGCCRHRHYLRSFYASDKKHGLHCASSMDDCPAGWYITEETESGTYYNVYHHPGVDPRVVPQIGWIVYKGRYAKSGFRPLPEIKLVSGESHGNHDGMCLCYDRHDMETPHRHMTSLVDSAVKSTVVRGAFELLEQLRHGAQRPRVQAYIPVDIAGTDLYHLLCSAEELFDRCDLQGRWTVASTKHKVHTLFGAFLQEGTLTVGDLERFCVQSAFQYTTYASSGTADPLQLLDFVDLLERVGSRAFPLEEPRSAFNAMIASLQSRLRSQELPAYGLCEQDIATEEDEDAEEGMWCLFGNDPEFSARALSEQDIVAEEERDVEEVMWSLFDDGNEVFPVR